MSQTKLECLADDMYKLHKCVSSVAEFVKNLPEGITVPSTDIDGDTPGEVKLYWRDTNQYLVILFNDDKTISYFFQDKRKNIDKSSSKIDISQQVIPDELLEIIKSIDRPTETENIEG